MAFTFFNLDRRAEFDSTEIRWFVGKRLKRTIKWDDVEAVEYGNLTSSLGTFRPRTNVYLLLFGKSGKVLLRLNNLRYQSAPGSIQHAIEETVSVGKARGIHAVNKDVRF